MDTIEDFFKRLSVLFILSFSLSLSAQTPMFTTDVLSLDGNRYALSNKGTKSVTLTDKTGKKSAEWAFDDPITGICNSRGILYATSSYGRGWLTSIDPATGKTGFKTETGLGACSPVVNTEGSRIYVFNQFSTTVSEVDAGSGKVIHQARVLREPVSGVLTPDGKYLYVINSLPAQCADVDYVTAEVSVIDLSDFKAVKHIKLENGSNALRGICISTDGRYVFVSHNLGRFQVPTSQLNQGWMNTNALSVIDVQTMDFVGSVWYSPTDR